ncbi:hypothetical protein GOB93_15720 [Acetobacter musti]|uniref:Uncharacterized protein n=1 Tax=Acetobacter musti TaxID=864732 RepID=A0ABX0JX58_9PROT|nr:hypothetical protein [Acetobacter musti]NHN86079.1 hypothetical protein [Acetobacter musti]
MTDANTADPILQDIVGPVFEPARTATRRAISIVTPLMIGQAVLIIAVLNKVPAAARAYESVPGWYRLGLLLIWMLFNLEAGFAILTPDADRRLRAVVCALVLIPAPYMLAQFL